MPSKTKVPVTVNRETAFFLNKAVNHQLVYEEKTGSVDMCKAMERKEQKDKITGIIETYRLDGLSDEDIIAKVLRVYNITREYVLALLKAQVA